MANQNSDPCPIHNVPKKKLPEQYYCPKCKNEYQVKRNRRELLKSKEIAARRKELPKTPDIIIFD